MFYKYFLSILFLLIYLIQQTSNEQLVIEDRAEQDTISVS